MSKKNKNKKAIIIILVVVIVCAVIGGFFLWKNLSRGLPLEMDEMAKDGFFEDKTQEDIDKLLNQMVADGMFSISINSNPVFESGSSEGNLRIENAPNNLYYMKVKITLDETGETVYESKGIKQKQFIEKDKLAKDLQLGEYPCTAVFTAIDSQSYDEVGKASAKIKLSVLS